MEELLKKEALKKIKESIAAGKQSQAYSQLCAMAEAEDDFAMQTKYASYLKHVIGAIDLKKIRVAVLASSTVSHFNDVLKWWLAKEGFAAEIYEPEYSTVHQSILDPQGKLYEFNPDIVCLFTNYRDVKMSCASGLKSASGARNLTLRRQ
jgi:hypothetical protein